MTCMFFAPQATGSGPDGNPEGPPGRSASLAQSIVEAIHVELLFVYHRVVVKLVALGKGTKWSIKVHLGTW